MEKAKKLFWVSRPISWVNTAYPFAAGYLVTGGSIDAVFILATLYFLGPYNLLMYGVNDIFDYESDIRNPRKGGIEGMREQRSLHPVIMRAVTYTNVPLLAVLALLGGWVSAAVLALVVFFVVAYSIAKLRFKERPVLDSITSSLHFVGPLLFALSLTGFSEAAMPYLIAFFLWGTASHALGAVQDILPDREGGLKSVATFFGARWTVRFAILFYLAAVVIVAMQGPALYPIALACLLYAINCLPYVSVGDSNSAKVNTAWRRFIWLNFITGAIVTITLILV